MPGRAPALILATAFAACDGPIRLDVVTTIPSEGPGGGSGNTGNTGNAGSTGSTGNTDAGGETSGGAGGSMEEGGAAGSAGSAGSDMGGAGGADPGPPPWEAPALYRASFASLTLPGQYIRHENALAWVTPIDAVAPDDPVDATFEVIAGMIGDEEDCFSIRRMGGDFSFMRHSGSRVRFNLAEDEPLFFGDATFCFEPGLAEPTWISLRSYNYPDQYVRMVSNATDGTNELWIAADDGSPEFAVDATFRLENPFQQPGED